MPRLIDADEFKKQIAGMAIVNNYPPDKANKMCELIDRQPTAYDVDKVVEKVESRKRLLEFARIPKAAKAAASNAFVMAIEDIKSGGIE